MLVMIFALLAVIFMGISIAVPWYTMTVESKIDFMGVSQSSSTDSSYWLFQGDTYNNEGKKETKPFSDKAFDEADMVKSTSTMSMVFTILGLVFAILVMLFAMMTKKKGGRSILLLIFALLAFIFCMLGPVLYAATLPGAIKADTEAQDCGGEKCKCDQDYCTSFSGTKKADLGGMGSMTFTWGPGMGWIMALVGFIMALLAFVFVFKIPKAPKPAPTMAPAPGAPAPMMAPAPGAPAPAPAPYAQPAPQQQYQQPPPQQQYQQPPQQQAYGQPPPQQY